MTARRRRLVVTGLLLCAAAGAPQPASAQRAPRIEAWLYQPYVIVQTDGGPGPRLRLFDADGALLSDVQAPGETGQTSWRIDLTALGRPEARWLLRPGRRIEVVQANARTELTLPALTGEIDAATDRVWGRAPTNASGLTLRLHREGNWYPGLADPPAMRAELAADGGFAFELAGRQDLAPGWYAELLTDLPGGHRLVQSIAVPAVTFSGTSPVAYVRANMGSQVVLALLNRIDTELFRSGPGQPVGSGLYRVPLYPGGNPDFGAYAPQAGERVGLEIDGLLRVDAPLPRALASLDRAGHQLWGLTEPGAAILWGLTDSAGAARAEAGADGRFAIDLPETMLDADSTADLVTWPGGPVARFVRATLPFQQVILYDNSVSGRLPGWGHVRGALWRGETRLAWEALEVGDDGAFLADFRGVDGQEPQIRPGDRIIFEPELGRALALDVPSLTAVVDPAAQRIAGRALPEQALDLRAYYASVSIFTAQPFDRVESSILLSTRSDAAGSYAMACAGPPCEMRYGLLAASVADDRYYLLWTRRPVVGLGVTARSVSARGSAGLEVTLRASSPQGQPLLRAAGNIAPRALELPAWETDLSAAYPDGVPIGARVTLQIADGIYSLQVPELKAEADVVANRVSGSGPPGQDLAVVAYARGLDANRRGARSATGSIGANGRWSLTLGGFDLRAGDDVEVYLLYEDRYLWWNLDAVEGQDPPTRVPTPTPTLEPTPSPPPASDTAEPVARPARRSVVLPWIGR